MTPVTIGKAVAVGTAVVGISMIQMVLTGMMLAVGFQLGGILVAKVSKAIEDADLARQEKEAIEPEVVEA